MPTTLILTTPAGAVAQVLTVPTQWADVTLAQFVALHAPQADDTRRPAELLLGLEAGGLDQLAVDSVKYIANLLHFAADVSDVLALLPTPGLPDVGALPYGLLLEAQAHMQAQPDRPMLVYGPYILALYRIQLAYGKYDGAKVAACLEALLTSKVTECYGDLAHFLKGLSNSLSDTPQTPMMSMSPTTTKRTPAQNRFLSSLGLFSGSTSPPVEAS